jgi:hypothetical protein
MLEILKKIYDYFYSNYFFYYYVYDEKKEKYSYEKIMYISGINKESRSRL